MVTTEGGFKLQEGRFNVNACSFERSKSQIVAYFGSCITRRCLKSPLNNQLEIKAIIDGEEEDIHYDL